MLKQLANGRLESVLSKQFYVLHMHHTQWRNDCFIFEPAIIRLDVNCSIACDPATGCKGLGFQLSYCQ